jgi:hypothetical protein
MILIRCATFFFQSLKNMGEADWKAIIDGAQDHLPDKKRGHGGSSSTDMTLIDDQAIQDPVADFVMAI